MRATQTKSFIGDEVRSGDSGDIRAELISIDPLDEGLNSGKLDRKGHFYLTPYFWVFLEEKLLWTTM